MEPVDYTKLSSHGRRKVRQQYIIEQKNLCHHCQRSLSLNPRQEVMEAKINKSLFPTNFFDHPVHLHHNHVTGMTIGAVHARCNAYLWQFKGE
ncbi:hypothetical protein PP747_gp035 [Rhizobium phage RHph_Y38]|uniref:Uncharacterized protein n=2 Tax=Acanvirus TaxID=3044653 RepID=A0A7S5QX57_9CAUD|nr:hypothetical protein PP747_gp035 [Rhizobium phage RHph_Y38]YP_010658246.1 hypothetical protein PP749_gp035 [Rhizobium phage RHEph22]QIG67736.1 hypothetical protein EVB52_035 [Rhizobium phage RHph_Y38]QXV74708.1 hypothetical protein [Rhizobium phage RHEph22]QXV74802.1 hypothetical protein [Rhizobium phage RHEph24]